MHKKAMEMAKCAIDDACAKGYDNMTSQDWDDFKDCMEVAEKAIKADYYYHIVEAMEEADKEDEEEAKYIMKKMKEEYGEEEGERRFYDNYRYKRSGRFAPKGRGSYMPRRGYEEVPYMMMPQVHNPIEWDRDMDRGTMNRMYFSSGGTGGNSSGGSSSGTSSSGMSGGSSGNSSCGYEEYQRGYSEGRAEGYNQGRSEGERSGRQSESRYDKARRGYEETKATHGSNSAEDKQARMKEAEKTANVFLDALVEMVEDESPEVKSMIKTKGMSKLQKIQ